MCSYCQPIQTSVVSMIFLRLVEDAVTLQTVPIQRRRDILNGLTDAMPSLFPCFVQTLQTNSNLLRTKVNSPSHNSILILLICDTFMTHKVYIRF